MTGHRVEDLEILLNQAYRALESLTPGGSEFHESPDNCAAYVRRRLDVLHHLLTANIKRRKAAELALFKYLQAIRVDVMPDDPT